MAVKLHQLSEERAEVVIPVGNEKLEITYRPSAFTPATVGKLEQASESGSGMGEVVNLLAHAIVEWGLLDEKGKQIPVTVETLNDLPIQIVNRISQEITGSMGPNESSAGD